MNLSGFISSDADAYLSVVIKYLNDLKGKTPLQYLMLKRTNCSLLVAERLYESLVKNQNLIIDFDFLPQPEPEEQTFLGDENGMQRGAQLSFDLELEAWKKIGEDRKAFIKKLNALMADRKAKLADSAKAVTKLADSDTKEVDEEFQARSSSKPQARTLDPLAMDSQDFQPMHKNTQGKENAEQDQNPGKKRHPDPKKFTFRSRPQKLLFSEQGTGLGSPPKKMSNTVSSRKHDRDLAQPQEFRLQLSQDPTSGTFDESAEVNKQMNNKTEVNNEDISTRKRAKSSSGS